jgi:hypothetical protein
MRLRRRLLAAARSPAAPLACASAEGWVTSIACPVLEGPDILLSSSRDKSVILWTLTREDAGPTGAFGYPRRALRGHSHFVQDVVISSDGQARSRTRECNPECKQGLGRRRGAGRQRRRIRAPSPHACAAHAPAACARVPVARPGAVADAVRLLSHCSSRCPARGTALCACGT